MADRRDIAAEALRIQDVITRLFVGTDRRDWAAVRRCFEPTVHFDMTSLAGGTASSLTPDEITSGWETGLAPIEAIHHQVGNFLVDVDGDRALASCYGIALHYKKTASGRNTRSFVGSYDFTLHRARGDWFINSFRFNLKFLDGNLELEKG
jgi:hypothetical protein